jgi:hypothetical protein
MGSLPVDITAILLIQERRNTLEFSRGSRESSRRVYSAKSWVGWVFGQLHRRIIDQIHITSAAVVQVMMIRLTNREKS